MGEQKESNWHLWRINAPLTMALSKIVEFGTNTL